MKKIDKTVLRETLYIAAWSLILSAITQAVFLIISKWDITVLAGNALSYVLTVGNFFFMALTVQIALEKEEKQAKNTIKLSQSLRMIILFAFICVGASLPQFNVISLLIPLIFPIIAVAFRQVFDKSMTEAPAGQDEEANGGE